MQRNLHTDCHVQEMVHTVVCSKCIFARQEIIAKDLERASMPKSRFNRLNALCHLFASSKHIQRRKLLTKPLLSPPSREDHIQRQCQTCSGWLASDDVIASDVTPGPRFWVPTGNGQKDQDDGGMDGSRKGSKTSPASRAVPATHSVGRGVKTNYR